MSVERHDMPCDSELVSAVMGGDGLDMLVVLEGGSRAEDAPSRVPWFRYMRRKRGGGRGPEMDAPRPVDRRPWTQPVDADAESALAGFEQPSG